MKTFKTFTEEKDKELEEVEIEETALPAVGMKVSQSGGSEPYNLQDDEVLFLPDY